MTNTPTKQWTINKAMILAGLCLVAGIAGGWSIRGSHSITGVAKAASVSAPAGTGASAAAQIPSPTRLKEMADAHAAPLLDQLKSAPNNPDLLASVGNVYYDAQQYLIAVDYYGRALKDKPADASVRTDMATAYWFMGNTDTAIAEFNKALTWAPNNPNTLFNLGVARWQGKQDGAGALADWEKLLAANPNYDGKDKVVQMMAEVRKHVAENPGIKAN